MHKFTYCLLFSALLILVSCGKKKPSLVYFPDMYYPVAYDPYQEAVIPYKSDVTDVSLFSSQSGQTALFPVFGTIPRNFENIIPLSLPNTPEAYAASKLITTSPLKLQNREEDLARGKDLFEKTCSACHGVLGDGEGPIIQSGAYLGVPNYKDRVLSVGSVFYVIEHGKNAMGSYAGQLVLADRWRVAEYVMEAFKKEN